MPSTPTEVSVPAEPLRILLDYLEAYEALDWTDEETEAYQALCRACPKDVTTRGQHRPEPSGACGEHS